jgi:hypothetical protein
MRQIFAFASIMALVASNWAAYESVTAEVDEGVLIFTDENFDTQIAKYE